MKYACLVYLDPAAMAGMTAAEGVRLTDGTVEFDWELRRRGQLVLAQPLEAPATAVTIRVRNGKASRTDGPFAETKEFLGGFFLVEAVDIEVAIALAEASPIARYGAIEVRPFLEQQHSVTGAKRPPLEGQ